MIKYSIGIDLGTTHSCVGVYKHDGIVDIIANEHGIRTTPSYVSFTDSDRNIGKIAKDQIGRNPKNTVYDIKRLIGRDYNDSTIQKELKYLTFDVLPDKNNKPTVHIDYLNEKHTFYPEQISGMILEKMKNIAENYVEDKVTDVVVTVPAYFNDSQRQATKDAGKIAGLNILRIINEPTAAAIAYGLNKHDERNVLIYDLGGGTLDVTILTMNDGVFKVKSTCGDTYLGGEDFDNRLREFCLLKFAEKYIFTTKLDSIEKTELCRTLGIMQLNDIFNLKPNYLDDKESLFDRVNEYIKSLRDLVTLQSNAKLMSKLKRVCEDAKKSLSTLKNVTVELDNFYNGEDLCVNISRSKFEILCKPEFDKCLKPVDQALEDSRLKAEHIDDVVLVGGSSRLPKIHELLNDKFPEKLRTGINPDEAVAYGASIQAAIINQDFDDVTGNLMLVDVTPLSLGIETSGGIMEFMIKRNTSLPIEVKRVFSTSQNNQPMVTVKVYEGERTMTKNNNLLGKFNLKNITPQPKGVPQIEVTFNVDINGIMTVTACEKNSEKDNVNNIVIKNEKGRLSDDDITSMIADAEKFLQKDKEVVEKINVKNDLENYIDILRRNVESVKFQDHIGEKVCVELTQCLNNVVEWVDDNDDASTDGYKEKYKLLEEKFLPILEESNKLTKV
jgi:heat shock 70kDa protein 1/2/6/8